MSPADIKVAYGLNAVPSKGEGQVLALFELDGYRSSDISTYAGTFGISPPVPLQTILVNGFGGSAGPGASEVTLDIELMMALAPRAAKIMVYEGPNTDAGVIDVYQRIANDNIAKQVSTSWGLPEDQGAPAIHSTENQIFQQMAAQGQTIFAASGDNGAFDDGRSLGVDDPAAQPYVTGVGGTKLVTDLNHAYRGESIWWDGRNGGGGGVSKFWPIPPWQIGMSAIGASVTRRNVPDVSLNSDPATGYSIFSGGRWNIFGGTSCAAPLWAAFTALVNQQRVQRNLPVLGFANPELYRIGKGPASALAFHDIADQSTNGQYRAVSGYDLASGWGTINGPRLFAELVGGSGPGPSPSPSPTASPPPISGIAKAPLIGGVSSFVTQNPFQQIPIDYDVSNFPGAGGVYLEISQPNKSFAIPNGTAPDPDRLQFANFAGATGRGFIVPAIALPGWGDYSIRVIPLNATGQAPVGLFSDPAHLVLAP
jgi:kumamolisin